MQELRINKYVAQATGISRRKADEAIAQGRVVVNNVIAVPGTSVGPSDTVTLDNVAITPTVKTLTIVLNKPVGYVCSRDGQGSKTIYDLLPAELHKLKPVGRLDKDSSGLLLLTNDGKLAHELTHPSFQKVKQYEIRLNRELTSEDFEKITKQGVKLEDGTSKLGLDPMNDQNFEWKVTMHEGRNRQIRRTFSALDYTVKKLHRIHFGKYNLSGLESGSYKEV